MLQKIKPDWANSPCIVAAPGPGLTTEVVETLRQLTGWRFLVCQDAYRLMPWADVLYGCEPRWWNVHKDCDGFAGVKWSTHDKESTANDKIDAVEKYDINIVKGAPAAGFSLDPGVIHYGDNSGFQALNLAILLGSDYIVLVGFDMRHVSGRSHFFGDHPRDLFQRDEYQSFVKKFEKAPAPDGVRIINATPGSALTCYEVMRLEDAIGNHCLHRHRPVAHAAAN